MLLFKVTITHPDGTTTVTDREIHHGIEDLFEPTFRDTSSRKAVVLENLDGTTQRWELI
jgi:hypothetical protein